MNSLDECFDSTIEVNEDFHDTQLASNPKMIELMLVDSRHGSVRRKTEDSPKTNEIRMGTQKKSVNLVHSENKTDSKRVFSDQKVAHSEVVKCEQLENLSDSLLITNPGFPERSRKKNKRETFPSEPVLEKSAAALRNRLWSLGRLFQPCRPIETSSAGYEMKEPRR